MPPAILQRRRGDDRASQVTKAQYPLREARVEVTEVAGKPGSYTAKVYMRPWLQFEELTAALSMVAKLPASKG